MIIDSLSNASKYFPINKRLESAFSFLQKNDLNKLSSGNYLLDDCNLFAIINETNHTGIEKLKLEKHKKYIDIHYTIVGTDILGWRNTENCSEEANFNKEKDFVFLREKSIINFSLPAGYFVIFFPDDAHFALAGEGNIKKVVIKVLL